MTLNVIRLRYFGAVQHGSGSFPTFLSTHRGLFHRGAKPLI